MVGEKRDVQGMVDEIVPMLRGLDRSALLLIKGSAEVLSIHAKMERSGKHDGEEKAEPDIHDA